MLLCNYLEVFFDGLRFKVLELGFRALVLRFKDFAISFRVMQGNRI